MASIKVLNIVLVLMCIVVTAFICTFLAITSSDTALDDTKQSRDTSVNAAFAVGEESVQNRTQEYLTTVVDGSVDYMVQFLKQQRLAGEAIAEELMASPWNDVKQWDFHKRARYYWTFKKLRAEGSTGIGVFLSNRLVTMFYEEVGTVTNGPDGYHSTTVFMNYGDDHPWGGVNRSFTATAVSPTGAAAGVANPLTDVNFVSRDSCNLTADVLTNGSQPSDPCGSSAEYQDPTLSPLYQFSLYMKEGQPTLWTPPTPIDVYLSINAYTPIFYNGVHSGFSVCAADLRHISEFLSRLSIGGPIEGHPSRGRVFITVRSNFLVPAVAGLLTGASHGNSIGSVNGKPSPIPPVLSTDGIIREVGLLTAAQQLDLEGMVTAKNVTVLNITTDYAPSGEDFYYRVGRMADAHGIDWYVHVAIDREHILGSIDRKTKETKSAIHDAEEKVADDLQVARTVLYVLVVVVAVVLIVMSAVFVLKIIEPLLALEEEMASVAVMKLEEVNMNRPLSALQEVHSMQKSFFQMTKNLVEYRNFLPASVQDNTEDEDEAGATSDHSSETGSRRRTSHNSSMSRISTKHVGPILHGTEARAKRVTLMGCNVLSFLQTHEAGQILSGISHYLHMAQGHVKRTKGIPDSFSGDRLYASWNGAKPCASHRTAAYNCARSIVDDTSLGRRFSIGLVSGEVKCGNMGCEGMKKFTFVGSLASWVHIAERVGRIRGSEITIDHVVHEEVDGAAHTRLLQHVIYRKHAPSRTLFLHEALKKKEMQEAEWMYQLEQGADRNPNKAFNASYELYMNGDLQGAKAALAAYPDDGSEVVKRYRERLVAAEGSPALCEPMGKNDPLVS